MCVMAFHKEHSSSIAWKNIWSIICSWSACYCEAAIQHQQHTVQRVRSNILWFIRQEQFALMLVCV